MMIIIIMNRVIIIMTSFKNLKQNSSGNKNIASNNSSNIKNLKSKISLHDVTTLTH